MFLSTPSGQHLRFFILFQVFAFVILLNFSSLSFAQDYADDPFEYDHDIGVVGRKNFDASNRFDLTFYGGGDFFNILTSDYLVGGGLRYYFSDTLGLDLRGVYHIYNMSDQALLAESIAASSSVNSFYIDFIEIETLGHLVIAPFYGKHHLWGTSFVNYQLYFILGGGLLSLNQVVILASPNVFTYGGSVGMGFKFYLSGVFHLVFEARELIYQDNSFDDSQLSSQFSINAGLGFTIPTFDRPKRKI
jgi:outer membrane beta-barrel protein